MSLKFSSNKKSGEVDEISLLFKTFEEYLDKIIDVEHKKDKYGKKPCYNNANYFYYLMFYLITVRNHFKFLKSSGIDCPEKQLYCDFKLDCVRENLRCLSMNYEVNFLKSFDEMKAILGIPDNDCNCCVGIGEMQIESLSCNVFEVNKCDE
jgi:hypothetical protein